MTLDPLLDSGYRHPHRGFLKVAAALAATIPARLSAVRMPSDIGRSACVVYWRWVRRGRGFR